MDQSQLYGLSQPGIVAEKAIHSHSDSLANINNDDISNKRKRTNMPTKVQRVEHYFLENDSESTILHCYKMISLSLTTASKITSVISMMTYKMTTTLPALMLIPFSAKVK